MDDSSMCLNPASNVASLSIFNHPTGLESEDASQVDTALRLISPGISCVHGLNFRGTKRKWKDFNGGMGPGLALALQCSPCSSETSKRSTGTVCTASSAYPADEECFMDLELNFKLKLNTENTNSPKVHFITTTNAVAPSSNPAINLQLSLSVGASASSITSEHGVPAGKHLFNPEVSAVNFAGRITDDGTVSSRWENGGTSGSIEKQNSRSNFAKNCQSPGCLKGARGASGLCISHGGGRRCQKVGCQKGAEGRTIYCKAHGGGRRCEHLGCTKSAEGRTDFCIAHGGGRRCGKDDCMRAARGKSGLCIRHGGGKRCRMENCTKSAEGQSGLCIAHGGGRRCQFPECTKGAQGSTMYCKAHGGGKRCSFPNCRKGAEGSTLLCKGHGGGKRCLFEGGCTKSVHGGTQFCVAHGGGKRCAILECTKSARGRTDYCVRHGGGRRCQSDGCGKSAQGSTSFCKAHGGGKRCVWGEAGQDVGGGASGPRCDRFARGKLGLCAAHHALVQDRQVHGGDTIGMLTVNDNMKGARASSVPEGRVHGGSLMALLAAGAVFDCPEGSPSDD